MPYTSSIRFIEVKNTACLPLLRLFPSGINQFLIIEFNALAFPTWQRYSVNRFGISTLSCNSGSKVQELIGRVRIQAILKICSLLLLLLPELISNLQVAIAKRRRSSASCTLR